MRGISEAAVEISKMDLGFFSKRDQWEVEIGGLLYCVIKKELHNIKTIQHNI